MIPRNLTAFRLCLCAAAALVTQAAHALIVFDSSTSLDNSFNTSAPSDGAPWNYVAATGPNDASAVYLGNGWFITAAHVTLTLSTPILLDGTTYFADPSTPFQGVGNADLKLFKVVGDPGLPSLSLAQPTDNDLGQSVVRIACGQGKGSVLTGTNGDDVGFTWAGGAYVKRWGIAQTLPDEYTFAGDNNIYIVSPFDASLGPDASAASMGDSGGGVFEQFDGGWKLVGVTVGVDTLGSSSYNPSNYSFDVEINRYSGEIAAAIAPEPDTAALLLVGCVGLLRRRRGIRGAADNRGVPAAPPV